MPKVLAISSFVAHGTVGLQAAGPAAQALGHRVIALPSVVLSNHPGYGQFARQPVPPEALEQMLSALDGNGALEGIGAILTGYLPEGGHVEAASRAVALVKRRSPQAVYICDPVFGDDPGGFYLPEATAAAIKAGLLPMADLVTPNRFELSWLSGTPVDNAATATDAARRLGVATVVATSVPLGPGGIGTMLICGHETQTHRNDSLARVPHGTGDLLAGLLAGYAASSVPVKDGLAAAHAILMNVIARSRDGDDLDLSALECFRKSGNRFSDKKHEQTRT